MIYTFYIYNKSGLCIYYQEWYRTRRPSILEEEQKLMYGLLWSLKSFVLKSSPFPDQEKSFHFYKTNAYKLHFFESGTGFKFVLTTDPDAPDLRDFLKTIYKNVYVEYVVKNPLCKIGEPIKCELFAQQLQKEVQQLSSFKSGKH